MRRDRAQHDRSGGDARVIAHDDIAEDFSPGADHHARSDLRMPVPALFPGPAQRHRVQDRDVVADHRRLSHHQSGGVIEEDARPDPGAGVNVGLEHFRGPALQIQREIALAVGPEPVTEPVGLNRVKPLIIEQGLQCSVGGGVAGQHGLDIRAHRVRDRGIRSGGLAEGLDDSGDGENVVMETRRDPVENRVREVGAIRDGVPKQLDQVRRGLGGLLRFSPDTIPQGVPGVGG